MFSSTKTIDNKSLMRVRGKAFLLNEDDDIVTDFSTVCSGLYHFVKSCYPHDRTWLKSSSILLSGVTKMYQKEAGNLLNDAAKIAIFGDVSHSGSTEMDDSDLDTEDELYKTSDEHDSSVNRSKDSTTSQEEDEDLIRSDKSLGSHVIKSKTIRKRPKLVDYDDDSETLSEDLNENSQINDKQIQRSVIINYESVGRHGMDCVTIRKRPKLVDYEESETFTDDVDGSSKSNKTDYKKDRTYVNKKYESVERYGTDTATIQKLLELVEYEGSDTFTEVIELNGKYGKNDDHVDTYGKDEKNKEMPQKLIYYEESDTFTEILDNSSDS